MITVSMKISAVCALPSLLTPNYVLAQDSEFGTEIRDCETVPLIVVIPLGLCSSMSVKGHQNIQNPRHQVMVSYPFAVGRFEMTFREWNADMQEGGCSHHTDENRFGRATLPVIDINWEDANENVVWLHRTGVGLATIDFGIKRWIFLVAGQRSDVHGRVNRGFIGLSRFF